MLGVSVCTYLYDTTYLGINVRIVLIHVFTINFNIAMIIHQTGISSATLEVRYLGKYTGNYRVQTKLEQPGHCNKSSLIRLGVAYWRIVWFRWYSHLGIYRY